MVHYFGCPEIVEVQINGELCRIKAEHCKRVGKFYKFLTENPKIDASDAPAWKKFFEFITDKEVDLSDGKDDFLKTAKYFNFDDFDDFFEKHGMTVVIYSDYETYREKELPKYKDLAAADSKSTDFKVPKVPEEVKPTKNPQIAKISKPSHSGSVKFASNSTKFIFLRTSLGNFDPN